MKKLLFIIACAPSLVFSMNDTLSTKSWGINVSSVITSKEHFLALPALVYSVNRHSISLGPSFNLIDRSAMYSWTGNVASKPVLSFRLNGIHGSYRYTPSNPQKKFSPFVQYDLLVHQPHHFFQKSNAVEQFLSLGFNANIFKSFYLNASAGGGYSVIQERLSDSDFNNSRASWMVKAGLGYRF
jgi:hypothetical protein